MRQHINPDDINMSELLAIVGQNNRRQLEHALEELCRPVVQLFLKKHHIPPVHQPTIISQAKKILSEAVQSYKTTDQHRTKNFTGFKAYYELCLEQKLHAEITEYQASDNNKLNNSVIHNVSQPNSFSALEQKIFASYLLNSSYKEIAKELNTDIEQIKESVGQCAHKLTELINKQPRI